MHATNARRCFSRSRSSSVSFGSGGTILTCSMPESSAAGLVTSIDKSCRLKVNQTLMRGPYGRSTLWLNACEALPASPSADADWLTPTACVSAAPIGDGPRWRLRSITSCRSTRAARTMTATRATCVSRATSRSRPSSSATAHRLRGEASQGQVDRRRPTIHGTAVADLHPPPISLGGRSAGHRHRPPCALRAVFEGGGFRPAPPGGS